MMYRKLFLGMLLLFSYGLGHAMCGAMVSLDHIQIVNKSSRVIMVRDGNHTIVTMTNDFKGAVQNFAMVVPVPKVLRRKDIRVVRPFLFERLENLTAPRLESYNDPEPNCPQASVLTGTQSVTPEECGVLKIESSSSRAATGRRLKVKVNARYAVEEYDIVILSAKDSEGLQEWLTLNGYNLPAGATEALKPYIESGMKFFVVKVNLEHPNANHFAHLRPLQIQFDSPKFMLPIRLGMANAVSEQDMTVYAFSRSGRVETTNYRTEKIPTNREIPHVFMGNGRFESFYKAVFDKVWRESGKDDVFLEYAENLSSGSHLRPERLYHSELKEAGVWWLKPGVDQNYSGELFLTRLHVRYARTTFPQDLNFMHTPNKADFKSSYVVRIPAKGPFNCTSGQNYLKDLHVRFQDEVKELVALTGWNENAYQYYLASAPRPGTHRVNMPGPIKVIHQPIKAKPEASPKTMPQKETAIPTSKVPETFAQPANHPNRIGAVSTTDTLDSSAPPVNDTIPPSMEIRTDRGTVVPEEEQAKAPEESMTMIWFAASVLAFSMVVLGLVLFWQRRK